MPEDLLNEHTALGWLRTEHERINQLIASCLESDQPAFTDQVMEPLMTELDIHSTVERQVFFPFLSQYVNNPGFEQAVAFDDQIDSLVNRLNSLRPEDPAYFDALQQLAAMFNQHCFLEEQYGYLKVEMNSPDMYNRLVAIANEMDATRLRMLDERRGNRQTMDAAMQARAQRREAALENPELARQDSPRAEDEFTEI